MPGDLTPGPRTPGPPGPDQHEAPEGFTGGEPSGFTRNGFQPHQSHFRVAGSQVQQPAAWEPPGMGPVRAATASARADVVFGGSEGAWWVKRSF